MLNKSPQLSATKSPSSSRPPSVIISSEAYPTYTSDTSVETLPESSATSTGDVPIDGYDPEVGG